MITETILNVLLAVPRLLLSLLDCFGVNITLSTGAFGVFQNIFNFVGYIVPVSLLMPIFLLKLSIMIFRIVVAFIVRIKSFIPTMGA